MNNDNAQPPPRGRELRKSMSLVTLAWVFGSAWAAATGGAALTRFAQGLGASEFQFGLLAALPFIASLLSVPAGLWTDRTGRRKGLFLYTTYTQRLLWVPIALVPIYMLQRFGAAAAMEIFLILMFLMYAVGALGSPAWTSWMADLVPRRFYGSYFSRRRQWGILTAIPAALIAGYGLDRVVPGTAHVKALVSLQWCAVVFLCAAVLGVADIHTFQYIPALPAAPKPESHPFRMLLQPLRDRQFFFFACFVATLTFAVSFMGQFVTLYLIAKLHVTNLSVNLITLVAPSLAQLALLPVWGRATDRMGKKPVMAIASLGLVPVGFGWCLMNNAHGAAVWLGYALSAAGAALWTGVEVANNNMVLEFASAGEGEQGSGRGGGSSFVAVNSVIINIAGCVGGLTSGIIGQSLRNWTWQPEPLSHRLHLGPITFYEVLFALSGATRLLAVAIFLPFIHEPTAQPTVEALRFMTSNIYSNLFNAVQWPLKVVGLKKNSEGATMPK
jgi:MFS family permease